MRFFKPKSPIKKAEKEPKPEKLDEKELQPAPEPESQPPMPEKGTPLPAPEQDNPLPEPLADIASSIEHAMRCPKCNGYLRQYPGGFRLCPNCDSVLSY